MLKYLLLFLTIIALASCTTDTPSPSIQSETTQSQNTEKTVYIDVREPSEWSEGHIEGAIHVPLGQIESGDYSKIPKDVPVAVYCRSGRRSSIAVDALKKAGYTNVINAGGMTSVSGVKITE